MFILLSILVCFLSFSQPAKTEKEVELPIKTIQDEAGDIFDCIHIRKQPAFNHPLLKNHKIQMRPTSYPRSLEFKAKTQQRQSRMSLKGIRCPRGSVPIRRTRKDDAIHQLTTESPDIHLIASKSAVLKARPSIVKNYTGVEARFNILNSAVESQQLLTAQIWIENGVKEEENSIHAGWMVYPQLYNDGQTRTFIYWKGTGNQVGCYNLACPGFVQVDNNHPMGKVLPASSFNMPSFELAFTIYQDFITKNWWLLSTNPIIQFGYWPSELFPHLQVGAPVVGWGGIAVVGVNQTTPPMGFGYFPDGNSLHTGYFTEMNVVEIPNSGKSAPDPRFMETYADAPSCCKVKDYGILKDNGYTIMYGGPGGKC